MGDKENPYPLFILEKKLILPIVPKLVKGRLSKQKILILKKTIRETKTIRRRMLRKYVVGTINIRTSRTFSNEEISFQEKILYKFNGEYYV